MMRCGEELSEETRCLWRTIAAMGAIQEYLSRLAANEPVGGEHLAVVDDAVWRSLPSGLALVRRLAGQAAGQELLRQAARLEFAETEERGLLLREVDQGLARLAQ